MFRNFVFIISKLRIIPQEDAVKVTVYDFNVFTIIK